MSNSPAKPSKYISLSFLSEKRDYLFGIATLMVVIFHAYFSISALLPDTPILAEILTLIKNHFNKGVDMFLFMSGIGLYYSMSKKPKLTDFYKKRATRILPAVLIVSAIWFALRTPDGLGDYFSKVFFVSFFTEGVRNFWYFILLIFLYAVYPLIHKLYEKSGVIGLVFSILAVLGVNFILMACSRSFYNYTEIALTRIPVFLLGAYFGKLVKEGVKINKLWLVIASIVMIAIYVFYYFKPFENYLYIYRYLGSILAICQLLLLGALFSKCSLGAVGTFLLWLGTYSMEIYLMQEKVGTLLYNEITTNDPSHFVYYFVTFIISVLLAMALKAACKSLDKNLFYRNSGKTAEKLQG